MRGWPRICGRVCPQKEQCECKCILAKKSASVAIGNLERFAADYERDNNLIVLPELKPNNGKMGVKVGGGNVAMDAARTALRLGAVSSKIVYRHSEAEMPARTAEIHYAKNEGLAFNLLSNPVEILSNDKGLVTGIKCIRMELSSPDENTGKTSKKFVYAGGYIVSGAATVILAMGAGKLTAKSMIEDLLAEPTD